MYQLIFELLNYWSLGGAANSEYQVQESTDWSNLLLSSVPMLKSLYESPDSQSYPCKKAKLKLKGDCAGPNVLKTHHMFSASSATGQTSFHKPSLSPPPSSFFPPVWNCQSIWAEANSQPMERTVCYEQIHANASAFLTTCPRDWDGSPPPSSSRL